MPLVVGEPEGAICQLGRMLRQEDCCKFQVSLNYMRPCFKR